MKQVADVLGNISYAVGNTSDGISHISQGVG